MAYGAVGAAVTQTAPWVVACGRAAPIVSSGLFLAPVPTVKKIVEQRSVGNLPLLPYSSMCVNAFMWSCYGTFDLHRSTLHLVLCIEFQIMLVLVRHLTLSHVVFILPEQAS